MQEDGVAGGGLREEAERDDAAVGETSGQGGPRKVVSSGGPRETAPVAETQPLVGEADPELEKLLDEEEAIAKRTAQGEGHDTPHFRGED